MVSGTNLFIGLFNNLAFFIIIVAFYGFLAGYLEKLSSKVRQLVQGLIFGLFAIACMYVKIPVHEGVIVDQRNAVIALSGAFGGPLAAMVCAAIGAIYRLLLGGSGVLAGVVGCFLAAIAGIGLFYSRQYINSLHEAAVAAFLASVVILPGFMLVGDLEEGWALTKAMALPYGSAIFVGIFLVGILLENDERRRRASSALAKSEEQFRSMYSRMVDMVFQTSADGTIVAVTPSVEKILGYSPDDIVGKEIIHLYRDADQRRDFFSRIIRDGYVENFRAELLKKNGDVVWGSTNASLLRDAHGEILGIDGVTRDISRLKQAEKEKTEMEAILRQSQKMEAIGTLAGGIAHDFNNILSAVMGYSDLLRDSFSIESVEMRYLNNILTAANRAKQLTQQILTFSRKGDQVQKLVEMQQVIEETVNLLKKTIPSTVDISTELELKPCVIMGNSTQIHQILLNLCTNAFHAFDDEYGKISIRLYTQKIQHEENNNDVILPPGRYAVLTVKDNGKGIDPVALPKIFDPFFTTKPVGKGTGLGLSVVHGIVQSHGGAITAESELGMGTEFRVMLPISGGRVEESTASCKQLDGGNERILVIDDEQMLVDLAEETLTKCGYHIIGMTSPVDALSTFRVSPDDFDLVVTDQTMPNMPGHLLAQEMLRIRPEIPIILTTGHSALLNAKKAQEIGIKAFLMKPFDSFELTRMVRNVLDKNRSSITTAQSVLPVK